MKRDWRRIRRGILIGILLGALAVLGGFLTGQAMLRGLIRL